jgi:hypothetical protein
MYAYILLLTSCLLKLIMTYFIVGKELRLKQQYFWTAASLADIMRRFKNTGQPIAKFPECEYMRSGD